MKSRDEIQRFQNPYTSVFKRVGDPSIICMSHDEEVFRESLAFG